MRVRHFLDPSAYSVVIMYSWGPLSHAMHLKMVDHIRSLHERAMLHLFAIQNSPNEYTLPGYTREVKKFEGLKSLQSVISTTHDDERAASQSAYCCSRNSALRRSWMTFSMFSVDLSASLVVYLLSACRLDIAMFNCANDLSKSSVFVNQSNSGSSGCPTEIEIGIYHRSEKTFKKPNGAGAKPYALEQRRQGLIRNGSAFVQLIVLSGVSKLHLREISSLSKPFLTVKFATQTLEW